MYLDGVVREECIVRQPYSIKLSAILSSVQYEQAHSESRGPGGAMRNGWGCDISGFHVRKRLPALPASGVKNPAPEAIGTDLACASSGGSRFTGGGRGGNISSISGIDPAKA